MIEQLRSKAKELLQSGAVRAVIGYERGSDGLTARPAFIYQADDVARLIFDQTCTHNLVKYLLNQKDGKVALVVKPCDLRALNVLLQENQIKREQAFLIGVACPGVVEARWGQVSQSLQPRCRACAQHTPSACDFAVGELPAAESAADTPYQEVMELEGKPLGERRAFWQEQFQHCIRCYGCRAVCPGCYCAECFVDQLNPLWAGPRIAPGENWLWGSIRAFHLAGRCAGCDECERVCPLGLPLRLLNEKLEKDVGDLFAFQAGRDAETSPALATFRKEDLGGEK